jgi:hypothetical protein
VQEPETVWRFNKRSSVYFVIRPDDGWHPRRFTIDRRKSKAVTELSVPLIVSAQCFDTSKNALNF